MDFIANAKVRTKLVWSFGSLLALLAAISLVSAWRLSTINDRITQILDDRYAKVAVSTDIDKLVNVQARFLRNAIIGAKDPEELRSSLARVEDAVAENDKLMAQLRKMINTPKGEELFKTLVETRGRYGQ
ncbi:MCP four helix bundle domain-containing protein, partial [Leptospira sp. SA-E8]|uniref:MCP four helix bundle domain-containing protein n=1 Tax=Leptospira sp. SA-E8 TaxID=3422259 RepID=UPI003EBE741C